MELRSEENGGSSCQRSSPSGKAFSELLLDIEENSAICRQHQSTDDFSFSSVDESPFLDNFNIASAESALPQADSVTIPMDSSMNGPESKPEDAAAREAEVILHEATEKFPASNDSTADSGVFSSASALVDEEASEMDEKQLKKIHPRPEDSYMTLIAKAILASPDERAVLGEIYKFISHTYPYYRHTSSAWRNSVRHNLSVNECFVKAGRARNGRGFYWTIHPACRKSFDEGDFSRKVARAAVQHCQKKAEEARQVGLQSSPTMFQCIGYPTMASTPIRSPHYYYPMHSLHDFSHLDYHQYMYSRQMDPTWQQYSYHFNQGHSGNS